MQGALPADGDPAVEVLADFAGRESIPGSAVLVVDEGGSAIADALRTQGATVTSWRRHAVGTEPGAAFPPDGVFDLAILRLPRGREPLAMLAHWLAGRLKPHGELWVAGRNDEGIRSAGSTLETAFHQVSSRDARRHCRVLAAVGPRSDVRSDPAIWRTGPWVSWPGTFAHGRVDEGTALLLAALPRLAQSGDPFARTLDLGCGTGVIAAAVAALRPGAEITGVDADALALEAARANVPGMETRCLDASMSLGPGRWTAIVTNPPVHRGSVWDRGLAGQILARAVGALEPTGVLAVVALRGVPLGPVLRTLVKEVEVAAEDTRYRVWVARR